MSVKSSATVFRTLRLLAGASRPIGSADVTEALAVPISTAARALATLEASGYAERHHGSSRFVIGKSARALAFAFMAQFPVRDLAMPYLQQLTLEAALTSSLFVRLGWFAVRVGRILGPSVLIHRANLGESVPLDSGAPSLAILAHMSGEELERALPPPGSVDERIRATRSREAAQKEGLAIERSLVDVGAFDVAAPLIDLDGRVIASIAVEGATAEALPALTAGHGPVRRIMLDLAAKIRGGGTVGLSHYDHIDPDRITF